MGYNNDYRSLDLSDWGEDVSVGLFAPGPLKYSMTEELTPDTLTDFIQVYTHTHTHTPHPSLCTDISRW